jgi:hypothetical protein
MSNQERQPTRVGLSLGSTTRLNEFDFSKISLSLERDLVPAENPVDAYRDIKALLERMVTEFQVGKASQISDRSDNSSPHTSAAKTQQASHGTPTIPASKPAPLTVETVRERLAKWLPDLEILDGFNGFAVKPKRFLGEVWSEVNEVIRALGGKWQKGLKPADGSWRIPK